MTIIRQPIILTIFAACLLYGALWLANPYVVLLSFSLVIMIGLPHGLFDPWIAIPEFRQNISKLILFLTSYVFFGRCFFMVVVGCTNDLPNYLFDGVELSFWNGLLCR